MRRTPLVESLLQRFDIDPALIGDLVEQHRAGRSRLWLWRQAAMAIVVSNATALWGHKRLALRAVAVGVIAVNVLRAPSFFATRELSRLFGMNVGNYLIEAQYESLRWVFLSLSSLEPTHGRRLLRHKRGRRLGSRSHPPDAKSGDGPGVHPLCRDLVDLLAHSGIPSGGARSRELMLLVQHPVRRPLHNASLEYYSLM